MQTERPLLENGVRSLAVRVIVVGAGIMGTASALELADAGCDVVLLERAVPGAEASSAAAGMLGAQLESHDDAEFDVFREARDAYGAWAAELTRRSGVDVGYRVSGAMRLAQSAAEAEKLEATVRWHIRRCARAELLSGGGILGVEPSLSKSLVAAAHYPDEAQVEPTRLLRALAVAVAREPRIDVRSGVTVRGIQVEAGRATGVLLEDGALSADAVVLAAGSWSSLIGGVEGVVPEVRPSRGQLIELEERPASLRTILAGSSSYVVPRGDGRVVCGTTVEFVGFVREVTAGGVARILSDAIALVPSLEGATLGAMWSSFRPFSTSGAPLVGMTSMPGLVLATGHHRNGILLAPSTALAVRAALAP